MTVFYKKNGKLAAYDNGMGFIAKPTEAPEIPQGARGGTSSAREAHRERSELCNFRKSCVRLRMSRITIDNHDRVCYYGNPAGYLQENKAVIDPMFQTAEMEKWLTVKNHFEVEWQTGVFERLASGWNFAESGEQLKNVRVWQLKPDTDICMKFIGYDALVDKFGEPTPDSYLVAFDGTAGTNNLEEIYEKFNIDHPADFRGHSLSMSDVVELYDANANGVGMSSEFYYVDHFGFKEIDFAESQEQQQDQGMEMQF